MKHSPGFLAIVEESRARIQEISTAEYAELRASGAEHILIDVREESKRPVKAA
jgi:hypothetical protein